MTTISRLPVVLAGLCLLNPVFAHDAPGDHAGEAPGFTVVQPAGGEVWPIFGLEIVGKLTSEQTGGDYAVIINTTPPDGGPPLHVHEREDESFYVLEGTYQFTFGDETVTLSEGGMVFLPRGVPHTFRNVGDTPGRLLNTVTPGGFEGFFREIDALPKNQPLDRAVVAEIAAKYGLTFLPPRGE